MAVTCDIRMYCRLWHNVLYESWRVFTQNKPQTAVTDTPFLLFPQASFSLKGFFATPWTCKGPLPCVNHREFSQLTGFAANLTHKWPRPDMFGSMVSHRMEIPLVTHTKGLTHFPLYVEPCESWAERHSASLSPRYRGGTTPVLCVCRGNISSCTLGNG